MGFLGKLFGKPEKGTEHPVLSLDKALELSKKKLSEADLSEGSKLCRQADITINDIKANLKNLGTVALDPAYHKKLKAAATESRKQLIIKISKDLSLVQLPKNQGGYDELLTAQKTLTSALTSIAAGNKKHGYYTALAFRNEMVPINKNLGSLSIILNNLKMYLDNIEKQNKPYKEFLDIKDNKASLEDSVAALKERIKVKKAEAEKLENIKQELDKKLENFAELSAKEVAVTALENDLNEIKSKIHNSIAPLSRIFRKYKKTGVFEKPVGLTLNLYISEPIKASVADKDGHLAEILMGIEKMIKDNEFGLDEKEQRKTLRAITNIKENVPKLISDYDELNIKLNREKTTTSALADKKQGVDVQLKDLTFKLDNLNSEISNFEKTLAEKEEELGDIERDIKKKSEELR